MTFNYSMVLDVYADLGIDTNELGYVMIDCEPADTSFIPDDTLYYAKNPAHKYLKGKPSVSHVTVSSGPMPGVKKWHVDRVLEGLTLPDYITLNGTKRFAPTALGEDPYEVIVGDVSSPEVYEWHNRLLMLPNVQTFPDYVPHVTLAYTRAGTYDTLDMPAELPRLKVVGINYGDSITE